jgi:hypothetical protein
MAIAMITYNVISFREKKVFFDLLKTKIMLLDGVENLHSIINGNKLDLYIEEIVVITVSYDDHKIALTLFKNDLLSSKVFNLVRSLVKDIE